MREVQKEAHWKNNSQMEKDALDLFFFLRDQNTERGEKHLHLSWCQVSVSLPEKTKKLTQV